MKKKIDKRPRKGMTASQLANLRPIVKGEVRNPNGGRTHNKELRSVKALTQVEIAEVGGLILNNDVAALEEIIANPKSSVFKIWVCKISLKALERSDVNTLSILLDRIVGKVKEHVEYSGAIAQPVSLTDEQGLALIAKAKSEC